MVKCVDNSNNKKDCRNDVETAYRHISAPSVISKCVRLAWLGSDLEGSQRLHFLNVRFSKRRGSIHSRGKAVLKQVKTSLLFSKSVEFGRIQWKNCTEHVKRFYLFLRLLCLSQSRSFFLFLSLIRQTKSAILKYIQCFLKSKSN